MLNALKKLLSNSSPPEERLPEHSCPDDVSGILVVEYDDGTRAEFDPKTSYRRDRVSEGKKIKRQTLILENPLPLVFISNEPEDVFSRILFTRWTLGRRMVKGKAPIDGMNFRFGPILIRWKGRCVVMEIERENEAGSGREKTPDGSRSVASRG